jgi:hypothetical protein
MEWDFFDCHVVNEFPESPHHSPIQICVVLVILFVDQIEIPSEQPRSRTDRSNTSELLQESNFIIISLWPIYHSEPLLG